MTHDVGNSGYGLIQVQKSGWVDRNKYMERYSVLFPV